MQMPQAAPQRRRVTNEYAWYDATGDTFRVATNTYACPECNADRTSKSAGFSAEADEYADAINQFIRKSYNDAWHGYEKA